MGAEINPIFDKLVQINMLFIRLDISFDWMITPNGNDFVSVISLRQDLSAAVKAERKTTIFIRPHGTIIELFFMCDTFSFRHFILYLVNR